MYILVAYGREKVANLQTQETQMDQIATGDQVRITIYLYYCCCHALPVLEEAL